MKMLTLVRMTLVEQWRQKTPWGFLAVAVLMLLPAFLPLQAISINGQAAAGDALRGGLLHFAQFVALFLAAALTSSLLPAELERGTILLLVTKPLSRFEVLLGKGLAAGLWMLAAWTCWGVIAALALSIKLGSSLFLPTLFGFVASSLVSWVVVAFTLFASCLAPATTALVATVFAWILSMAARQLAPVAETMGSSMNARLLEAVSWVLPIGWLTETAERLSLGSAPGGSLALAFGLMAFWGLAAFGVFARRDLSSGG
ncbi:MAG TPA: ABC transporter permease [Stenomitos sp.]